MTDKSVDRAKQAVRALEAGKLVYVAVPMLAYALPFDLLDPKTLTVSPTEAAAKEVAARLAHSQIA